MWSLRDGEGFDASKLHFDERKPNMQDGKVVKKAGSLPSLSAGADRVKKKTKKKKVHMGLSFDSSVLFVPEPLML